MPRPGIGLGAPDSGMSMDADADPAADMGGDTEPADDFERSAKDALDDALPAQERWAALKEAIHQCFSEYESKPHEEAGTPSGAEKKGSGLLLALGLPKGGKKG